MIAAISLMRRRHDASVTQFRRHWLDVHGPLVCRFAGLRRYVQCHVIGSAGMNSAARAMRVDGFPILFFDNDADRGKAHVSPEMAACNIDSRQFIGAVSRVITDVEEIVPPPATSGRIGLIVVTPQGNRSDVAALRRLPGLLGLVHYHVREQGAAPNSTVPNLAVAVGDMAQAWFASLVDLECALAGDDSAIGLNDVALFVVEEHPLNPASSG